MSLFRRKPKAETADLATIMARRGIPCTANIVAMRPTGRTRAGEAEYEFRLAFVPHGAQPVEVTLCQFMKEMELTGLAAGEQATILYDRQDATTCVVTGSPTYRIVSDGVAVKVDPAARGMSAGFGWTDSPG
jgi:hypothetical protein